MHEAHERNTTLIYVKSSGNAKLSRRGNVDATYASVEATCPDTCAAKGTYCYAQTGHVGITVQRLDRAATGHTAVALAMAEASAIDAARVAPGQLLRVHVSGDSRTRRGTRAIAAAVARRRERGGGHAWSYTHAWRTVTRDDWGCVSTLASVESPRDVAKVRARGYAPAIVVDKFPSARAFTVPGDETGTRFVPCPAQTRDVTCDDCRLCLQDQRLFASGRGIAFEAHSQNAAKARRHLAVVQ